MPDWVLSLANDVAAYPLSVAVREWSWPYPALETLHIIGIALVFGSVLAFDLRVLGMGRALPVASLHAHLLPWVWTGFALNSATGALMFASDAAEFVVNPALQAKMGLLLLAGLNAMVFQARLYPALREAEAPASAAARLSAAASIALWLAVIVAGRLMAYVK
jgi:hypothetical protein